MHRVFSVFIRRITLILTPLLLVALEWGHPSGFSKNVFDGLSPHGDYWKWLHIYQSILFGAVAVGAFYLTANSQNLWAIISKCAVWVFAVAFLVFDSTGGIAVGLIIDASLNDPSLNLETVKELSQIIYLDPIVGGSGSLYSLTGSWAWTVALYSACISMLVDAGSKHYLKLSLPILLLLVSGYSLNIGHYSPYGPIAFGCMAAAGLLFELFKVGPAAKPNSQTGSQAH